MTWPTLRGLGETFGKLDIVKFGGNGLGEIVELRVQGADQRAPDLLLSRS